MPNIYINRPMASIAPWSAHNSVENIDNYLIIAYFSQFVNFIFGDGEHIKQIK